MAQDCYRAYNLIKNWISNQSVIKMEYIPFDAVFHALSESGIKKNGTQLSWTIFSQNTAGKFDFFLSVHPQYTHSL